MDNTWAPLVPTSRAASNSRPSLSSHAPIPTAHPSGPTTDTALDPFAIGDLPSSVVQRILSYVPVADLGHCALAGRALARFVADDRLWARKLVSLQWRNIPGIDLRYSPDLSTVRDQPATDAKPSLESNTAADDDFGDFEAATGALSLTTPDDESFGGFVTSEPSKSGQHFSSAPVFSYRAESRLPMPSANPDSAYQTFKRIAHVLKPFVQSLLFETSPTSSLIFTDGRVSSLSAQACVVCNIARFIGANVLGSFTPRTDGQLQQNGQREYDDQVWRLRMSIREAADYLEGVLLSAFEGADARRADALRAGQRGMDVAAAIERAEADMHDHAALIWEMSSATLPPSSTRITATTVDPATKLSSETYLQMLELPGAAAAQSFLEKRDILFAKRTSSHRPEANIVSTGTGSALRNVLDFTPMDAFMTEILSSVSTDGGLIARVFPAEQQVVLSFATRVASEVVSEYITAVLTKARTLDVHLYLQACAATFAQAIRISDALLEVKPISKEYVTRDRCLSIVLTMWEVHLSEYVQEERDWVRTQMIQLCHGSDSASTLHGQGSSKDTAFLASNNPAQVKRNVLSGFKDVLLMPVTVVPRAAGVVGGAVIRTAGTGLSQLNPLKWQSSGGTAISRTASAGPGSTPTRSGTPMQASQDTNNGYVDFSKEVLGQAGDDDESDEEVNGTTANGLSTNHASGGMDDFGAFGADNEWNDGWTSSQPPAQAPVSVRAASIEKPAPSPTPMSRTATATTTIPNADGTPFSRLQLLLSLDTALSAIQVHRESLKRMETFTAYSTGSNGARVREEMEEICLSFFQILSTEHIAPGFTKATDQISQWNPLEDSPDSTDTEKASETAGSKNGVLPLVQFFELTHIADTIQQLCSVYFAQTLSSLSLGTGGGKVVDASDFLNPVVRAKKAFEGSLDEFVAAGLSVSVDLLMKRAEWVLFSLRSPSDYNSGAREMMLDLGSPTKAVRECIEVLRFHCSLLVGATDREILDLFHQEISLRLVGILTKHIKSSVISQTGGFQLISDLNIVTSFIVSLKCKEPGIMDFYNSLKTLSSYYIVTGKELVSLLKTKAAVGGNSAGSAAAGGRREERFVFGSEELYEFLKSRSDFKSIEKQVDHEIFGFKISEDCCIM